jgi:hypothetical protein
MGCGQMANYHSSALSNTQTTRATKTISQGSIASTVGDGQSTNSTMSSGPHTVSRATLIWTIDCPSAETITYSFTADTSSLRARHLRDVHRDPGTHAYARAGSVIGEANAENAEQSRVTKYRAGKSRRS